MCEAKNGGVRLGWQAARFHGASSNQRPRFSLSLRSDAKVLRAQPPQDKVQGAVRPIHFSTRTGIDWTTPLRSTVT
jgi:hypothetical protein